MSEKMAVSQSTPPGIPDLPEDVFLLILKYLEPWEVTKCQKVSTAWRNTFQNDVYLELVLKSYPLALETRYLISKDRSLGLDRTTRPAEIRQGFIRVASRYYTLTNGKVREIQRYELAALEQTSHWYPVAQWYEHESQPGGRLYYENPTHISRLGAKPYLFHPTLWSYDDGLLVFAVSGYTRPKLVLLDVESETMHPIPFDIHNRVIRNLRLKCRTLIVEWAEKVPFHRLNESEKVHRHFASCFDVSQSPSSSSWTITFRSELKIHFVGLPLSQSDRFFSTNTSTHYAIYFHQPNRSMYTGDEQHPLETLFVWDITSPSTYLPSADPSNRHRANTDDGPRILTRLTPPQLSHLGIRQHSHITLTSFTLDSESCTLSVRENICIANQGYFDPSQRLWCAKTTSFPFIGHGPAFQRTFDGNLPPYRGHLTTESADVLEPERWFVNVMDVLDQEAEVRFSLVETCLTGSTVENGLVMRVSVGGECAAMEDELVREVGCMGRIAGDERWLVGQNGEMEIVVLKF